MVVRDQRRARVGETRSKMAMDALVFVFALLDDAFLLVLTVYFTLMDAMKDISLLLNVTFHLDEAQIITLSDLECDYLNARTCCEKLNKWILPEIVAHCALSLVLIVSGHWIIFCFYSSMTAWVVYKLVTKPSGNIGMYDPTEIHNRQQLKFYMHQSIIKLVFHLLFFFFYLYFMISSLLSNSTGG